MSTAPPWPSPFPVLKLAYLQELRAVLEELGQACDVHSAKKMIKKVRI